MKKTAVVIFTMLVSVSLIIPCFAADYSSYSKEQIEAEIERLENELAILYSLLEQTEETTEPETEVTDITKVLSYSGSGDDVISVEDYGDWFFLEVDGNYGGDYFGVIAYDKSGKRIGALVNTTEVYHGRVFDDTQSVALLEVKATGNWSIKIKSLYAARYAMKGDTVTGSGDDVLIFYTDKGESSTARITGNSGSNYFGVIGYNGFGSRTGALVNTTDAYNGTVLLKGSPRIFEILAEDNWSITFD